MNKHKPNPYTKERAERLHRKYLQMNSIGLATMSVGHATLGLVYGDLYMAGYFSLFIVFGLFYGFYFKSLSHAAYVLIGELLIVSGVAGAQFVLPEGAATAILLFPLGVTLLAFSQTLMRGLAVFVLGLFMFFSFKYVGFSSPSSTNVPQFLTFCTTLFYCGAVLSFQVNKARKSVENAVLSLVSTESELLEKEETLRNYQAKIILINNELDAQNEILIETLASESNVNSKLETERANQEELTKAIHRDLRNPLKSIVSASEALSKQFEENPAAKSVSPYLGFAIDGAKRMTKMLDDLLSYTKGNTEHEEVKVDLNEILDLLLQDLANLIERSNAKIEIAELPAVVGYPTQLMQLFQNLLSNAFKFSRPGFSPVVRIYPAAQQTREGYFLIRIQDNGIGIPENQLDSVFGLFNRAHVEEGYEGSGVGLALCKRIAVAHDAELSVTSKYGEGTQFTIAFPTTSLMAGVEERLMTDTTQKVD